MHQKHGEARLLDPNDIILSDILQQPLHRNEDNYLAKMESSFYQQFGCDEKPILLLFSYFIPCTLADHKCARLINEYASRNDKTIVIAYQTTFRETDRDTAVKQMVDDEVKVIPRKYIAAYVNTEIRHLFAAARKSHPGAVKKGFPKRRNDEIIMDKSVYKQLLRKARNIDKQHYRTFEETKPYRVCRNRKRHHRDKRNKWCFIDEYDDCN